MIKHLKKITLFVTLVAMQQSIKADIWGYFNDPMDQTTLKSVENLAEQEIEHQLQPHEQDADKKKFILDIKIIKKKQIRENISLQFLSKQQAKDQAKIQAQDFCINFVVKTAVDEAETYLKKLGFQYNISVSNAVAEVIYAKVKKDVMNEIRQGKRLSPLLKNIKRTVESLVDLEIQKLPVYKEKYYTENDITEIYPEGKVDLMRERIEQGKVYRDSKCTACDEKFSRIGKRINLPCGHGNFCVPCFTNSLHIYKVTSCPMCRAQFNQSDFSLRYLKQYADKEQMEIIKRNNFEVFKKVSKLFQQVR